jgi:hypothetical protein
MSAFVLASGGDQLGDVDSVGFAESHAQDRPLQRGGALGAPPGLDDRLAESGGPIARSIRWQACSPGRRLDDLAIRQTSSGEISEKHVDDVFLFDAQRVGFQMVS